MDERLKKFFDLSKYFMVSVSSVGEALEEARKTQEWLYEIIALEREIGGEYKKARREFDQYFSVLRANVVQSLSKIGARLTEQIIDDRATQVDKAGIYTRKEKVENLEMDAQTCQDLKMALYQRKDVIKEFINYARSKQESDSCLIKNKNLIKKLLGE